MRPCRFLILSTLLLLPSLGLSTTSAHPLREVELGALAPDFELRDSKGKAHSLAAHQGKAVVLCYFRPGQGFSDRSLELLATLRQRYSASEASVLAVRRPEEGVAPPAGESNLPFPVLLDPDRGLYGSWGLFVLPTTVVLDRQHRVAAAFSTFPEGMEDEVTQALDKALGRPQARKAVQKKALPAAAPETGMAARLLEDGRAAEAYASLEQVLKSPSPPPDVLTLAGEALLALGRTDEAASRCQEALKAEPDSPKASMVLGRARTLQNRLQEAETLLKAAAARSPNTPKARYWLGQLYEKMGRKDEALAEYRSALERSLGR